MKRIIFALFITMILFSCAAPEKKKTGPVVFYPALPQQPRIQYLTSIMFEEDLGRKQSRFDEFLLGEKPTMKRIGRPIDIGSVKGRIYVSDRLYKKIIIIDLEKNEFDYIRDTGIGTISDSAGIWITEDDMKYVTDISRKQILVFDDKNEFLKAYGDIDQFDKPMDVAVYGERIYVCDLNKNKIIVLDKSSGEVVQEIGELGREEGKLFKPSYITMDNDGNLYVTDSFNFRVQMFDSQGKYVKSFGFHGDVPGSFARPKGIAMDREKHLYVADAAFENVQLFDVETANLLLFFGGFGGKPGSMYLPAGVHIDYDNVEYFQKYADKDFKIKYLIIIGNLVSDKRIGVYGFGDWTGSPLPGIKDK